MVEESPSWSHVSRAPRSSVVAQVRGAFGAWLIMMIISGAIGLIFDLGASVVKPITSRVEAPVLPWWLILTLGCAFFLWFMRNHGLDFARNARSLSKAQCAVIVAVLGIQFLAGAHLHWLIAIGVTWALVVAVFSLDRLAAEGKAAAERIDSEGGDAA